MELIKQFEMNNLIEAEARLAQDSQCTSNIRRLWLSKSEYGSSIHTKFGMEGCRPVDTPIEKCKDFYTTVNACASTLALARSFPIVELLVILWI